MTGSGLNNGRVGARRRFAHRPAQHATRRLLRPFGLRLRRSPTLDRRSPRRRALRRGVGGDQSLRPRRRRRFPPPLPRRRAQAPPPRRRTRSLGQRPNPRRARNLGGGPIRQGRARGNALAESLSTSTGLSRRRTRRDEKKRPRRRRRPPPRATPWNPRGGATLVRVLPGVSTRSSLDARASGAGGFGRKARRRSKLHRGGPRRPRDRARRRARPSRTGSNPNPHARVYLKPAWSSRWRRRRGEVRRG